MHRLFVPVLVLLAWLTSAMTGVNAQPATPSAPPLAECNVAPRSAAALAEIVGVRKVAATPALASPVPYHPPVGKPADADTVAGITVTARTFAACANGGDYLRFLALFTDGFLRRFAVDLGLPLRSDDSRLTPTPLAANKLVSIAAIADVRILADGRVSALVVYHQPAPSATPDIRVLMTLRRSGDRWLIDDLRQVQAPAVSGTPQS